MCILWTNFLAILVLALQSGYLVSLGFKRSLGLPEANFSSVFFLISGSLFFSVSELLLLGDCKEIGFGNFEVWCQCVPLRASCFFALFLCRLVLALQFGYITKHRGKSVLRSCLASLVISPMWHGFRDRMLEIPLSHRRKCC